MIPEKEGPSVITLMMKDWRSTRFYLLLIVPWYVLFISQLVFLSAGLVESYLLLAWMIALAPAVLDLINGSEGTICSLPVTRSGIVRARYLFCAASSVAVLLFGFVHLTVLKQIGLLPEDAYGWLGTVQGVTSFLAGALIPLAILLPLTFWLGLIRGSIALIALFLIAAAVQTALYWNELRAGWHFGSPIESLARWVGGSHPATGVLVLWLLIAVVWWASWRIAGWLYCRRDL